MKRPNPYALSFAASLATSFLLLSNTAEAKPVTGYSAKPVAEAPAPRMVVRDMVWRRTADGRLVGSKSASRAAIVCESLVKKIGAVQSFSAQGEAFAASELAACNAKAKGGNEALARAD